MRKILYTQNDPTAMLARLALGVFMFPHGAQKALGWFGGHGIEGTVSMMGQGMHIPPFWVYMSIAAEFLGAIALILGLLSRVAAFGVIVNLIVAVVLVHSKFGWMAQQGVGMEWFLLPIALGMIVLIRGGGAASVDLALTPFETREGEATHLGAPSTSA